MLLTIDGNATLVGLNLGELGNQILRNLTPPVTLEQGLAPGTDSLQSKTHSGPNNQSTRHLLDGLVRHLEDNTLLFDFLNHSFGQDVNLTLFERRLSVVDKLLAEHGQHTGESLNKSNANSARKLGVPGFEIILQVVVQFATQLDTGGTAANDNHMEKAINFLRVLSGESGCFET
jgi:hypothetical protein